MKGHPKKSTSIPGWAIRWLNLCCPPELRSEIYGDLHELYIERLTKRGRIRALTQFLLEAAGSGRIRSKYKSSTKNKRPMLISNYVKTSLRNFYKHKLFSFLNVTGLAVGLTASLLIFQYVIYERSFDTFHHNASDIYRIQYNMYQNGSLTFECAAAVPAAGPAMKENFAEVAAFTRLYPTYGVVAYESPERGRINFREDKIEIADPSIFEVFDFKLIKGDINTCLVGPNKAVLSQSAARKYFGDENPIGKTIKWGSNTYSAYGETELEITGIMEDIPANSHIRFNFLFSFETIVNRWPTAETSWNWYDFNTYVLLQPGTDPNVLQSKWNAYLQNLRKEDWEKRGYKQEFLLQPMLDIHLRSNLLQESNPKEQGNANAVYFLTVIAVIILVIAWVNYINLSTAMFMQRAKEVGVRKVLGAGKDQLRNQFFVESMLVNFFSLALAILLVALFWPSFSHLTGRLLPFALLYQPNFWFLIIGLFFTGTIFSGYYPAHILSSILPASVLRDKMQGSPGGGMMRKGLVIFQFFASFVLITGTIIVSQQLGFMENHDLGVDIDKTVVLQSPNAIDSLYSQKLNSFKTEVKRLTGIKNVSIASSIPGKEIMMTSDIQRISGGPEDPIMVYNIDMDYDYVPTYNLKVIAGRNLRIDFPSDSSGILINRSLANAMNFYDPEKAIGEKVTLYGDTMRIAGVIEDYHQMSLKSKTAPILMGLDPYNLDFITLKLESADYKKILASTKVIWNKFFPGNPMDYFFLDQFYDSQYNSDRQFGSIFTLFSILAIFIACLGLFGLASFLSVRRAKEVGIRKAMGSTVGTVSALLISEFVKLVLIGTVIGIPVSWYIMEKWLEEFSSRITINPFVFIVSGTIILTIAVLSVGYQTYKIARTNPAKILKYE